jgi:hypothetical protein
MKGTLRFVIFALVCAHAHAQCCQGTFTMSDGSVPVQPKDEAACKAAKDGSGSWQPTCTAGTSCVVMLCTGKMAGKDTKQITSLCTTAELLKASFEVAQKGLTAFGATEVKCASGAPSSKFASAALLMVSVFVSLVVGSV